MERDFFFKKITTPYEARFMQSIFNKILFAVYGFGKFEGLEVSGEDDSTLVASKNRGKKFDEVSKYKQEIYLLLDRISKKRS